MLGSVRVNIYMQCPRCREEYGGAEQEYWRHGDRCCGVLQLDELANVICSRCGAHAHLTEMHLSCNSGRHIYKLLHKNATAATISCSAAFTDHMGIQWLQSVLKHLDR